jgi:hypothetical protein
MSTVRNCIKRIQQNHWQTKAPKENDLVQNSVILQISHHTLAGYCLLSSQLPSRFTGTFELSAMSYELSAGTSGALPFSLKAF